MLSEKRKPTAVESGRATLVQFLNRMEARGQEPEKTGQGWKVGKSQVIWGLLSHRRSEKDRTKKWLLIQKQSGC